MLEPFSDPTEEDRKGGLQYQALAEDMGHP